LSYRVQEIFHTLQGEGAQAGMAAVFLRFSGCNLWDGRPETRGRSACTFCDTDFMSRSGALGGDYPDADSLAVAVAGLWSGRGGVAQVVCTGGEPLLQLDVPLIAALKTRGLRISVETNGTCEVPSGIDWVCVSPKQGARWILRRGDELKIVWPQEFDLEPLERLPFSHFFLQPKDDPDPAVREASRSQAVRACRENPAWRLSLQAHKALGIP
jgi:7-carboxy-7-deazaguanine synthase